jgi:hypothetical protein
MPRKMPPMVALAVCHLRHHVPARVAAFEQGSGQLNVGQLHVAVDVIDGSRLTALQDQLDAPAVVIDVYPSPDVPAVPVQGTFCPSSRLVTNSRITFSGYCYGP